MGKLKDEAKDTNDWQLINLSEHEIMYLKTMLYLTEATVTQMRQLLNGFMTAYVGTTLAHRAGLNMNDQIEFDLDEKTKQLRIRRAA